MCERERERERERVREEKGGYERESIVKVNVDKNVANKILRFKQRGRDLTVSSNG